MEPRLDGPDRPTEPLGHRDQCEVRPVVQHDDDPLVRVERSQSSEDLVAIQDRAKGIAGLDDPDCPIKRDEADPAAPPESIATDVDEDPVKPRTEPVRIAQGSERSPGAEESILGSVLGVVGVAENQASEPIGAVELASGCPQEAFLRGRAARIGQDPLPSP